MLAGVGARRFEGAFGDAQVQIGHDQLRDLRAHGGLRRGGLRRRLQHQVGRQRYLVKVHIAAVGLALAERIPVRLHRDAALARRQGGDQCRLRGRVPGRHGQPVGTDRAGRKTLDAVQDKTIVGVESRDALVERVQGIAPEQALLHRQRQQAALLPGVAIQMQACQLQVVKAEHMGQRAVGARQDADHLEHHRPRCALAAEFDGDRQGQQARIAYPFALLRRMAAGLVAGVGGDGQARGQGRGDADHIGFGRAANRGSGVQVCSRHGALSIKSIGPVLHRNSRLVHEEKRTWICEKI